MPRTRIGRLYESAWYRPERTNRVPGGVSPPVDRRVMRHRMLGHALMQSEVIVLERSLALSVSLFLRDRRRSARSPAPSRKVDAAAARSPSSMPALAAR